VAALKGKVAIVTGATSGIGRASAQLLAAQGAEVVSADVSGEPRTDVGNPADVHRLVEGTVGRHGRIDILVHAAGICPRKPFLEMTDDDWRQVLRVNLDGTFYVTRDVARVMAKQRSGTMILISSDRGVHGSIDYAHYAASKGGMIALAKSLALTLGKYGVTVNAINPGLTDTPLARGANPQWQDKLDLDVLGKASEPQEIAEIVLFLAGTGGAFMTGQVVSARMRYGA
jgi:NAD(P)-dependent dehydrogenase (short-subunit alcohol dehydrogenase family)